MEADEGATAVAYSQTAWQFVATPVGDGRGKFKILGPIHSRDIAGSLPNLVAFDFCYS